MLNVSCACLLKLQMPVLTDTAHNLTTLGHVIFAPIFIALSSKAAAAASVKGSSKSSAAHVGEW